MVRFLAIFFSALTFMGVSAQTPGTTGQYVLDTIAALQANATKFQIEAQKLNSLSCAQYLTRTSPFTAILPILEDIKADLLVANPVMRSLTPLNDSVCTSADFAVSTNITAKLGGVTSSFVRSLTRLSGKGQLNACSLVPSAGQAIRTPLEQLSVVVLEFYLSIFPLTPFQGDPQAVQYNTVQELLALAIAAYSPVVGILP
ncbi:hypothetical protein QC763_0007610 [Podospora pseudopauciseta]|uniref:Uncharacterized protein n=1 Tax=Podospora pseudopauciseta TaxID=2093780 RepID=A0ABR0HXG7_9PEZI|nr:hypothetical protein QC763_0007610 [Podospora pseudopauciseta]